MNPKVAKAAALVSFDAADYTWVDLSDRNITNAEIHSYMQDLQSYPVAKMPMLFEKMAVLLPPDMGEGGVATLERVEGTLRFAMWTFSWKGEKPPYEVFLVNRGDDSGGWSVNVRVDEQLMTSLQRTHGKDKAEEMITQSAGRIVAVIYCATLVDAAVTESYTCPRNPSNEKRRRKKKLPLYEWKTIMIDPNEVKRVRDAARASKPREKYREHEVRGHWAVRRKSGKRYWVRAHKRGDPSKGSVFHDYQLKGEKK